MPPQQNSCSSRRTVGKCRESKTEGYRPLLHLTAINSSQIWQARWYSSDLGTLGSGRGGHGLSGLLLLLLHSQLIKPSSRCKPRGAMQATGGAGGPEPDRQETEKANSVSKGAQEESGLRLFVHIHHLLSSQLDQKVSRGWNQGLSDSQTHILPLPSIHT